MSSGGIPRGRFPPVSTNHPLYETSRFSGCALCAAHVGLGHRFLDLRPTPCVGAGRSDHANCHAGAGGLPADPGRRLLALRLRSRRFLPRVALPGRSPSSTQLRLSRARTMCRPRPTKCCLALPRLSRFRRISLRRWSIKRARLPVSPSRVAKWRVARWNSRNVTRTATSPWYRGISTRLHRGSFSSARRACRGWRGRFPAMPASTTSLVAYRAEPIGPGGAPMLVHPPDSTR